MFEMLNSGRKSQYLLLFLLAVLLAGASPEKSKVLIIGDSISIGYTPFVKEILADEAIVIHNPGNAQHTGNGLEKIEEWIGEEDWDIIQFNWGLWDLAYRHPDATVYGNRDKVNGTVSFTVEQYAENLEAIVRKVRDASDAQLVFVTTSYVPEGEAGRFKKDPVRYNRAAKKIMKKYDIPINHIYSKSRKIHKTENRAPDDVYFTEEGSRQLGEIVANFLQPYL
jgi:hypothetical protein